MTPETPPTENIFGIAKRICLDLEKLPFHSQVTVVGMVRAATEHRKAALEIQLSEEQMKANEAAMAEARQRHAEAQIRREEEAKQAAERVADQIRTTAADEPKKPRQVIELDTKRKFDPAADQGVSVEDALKIVTEPTPDPAELVQA